MGTAADVVEELQPAVLRLVSLLFSSVSLFPSHAAAMLDAAGYEKVRVFPATLGVPIRMIIGRRPIRWFSVS